jgi:hypothetical protein
VKAPIIGVPGGCVLVAVGDALGGIEVEVGRRVAVAGGVGVGGGTLGVSLAVGVADGTVALGVTVPTTAVRGGAVLVGVAVTSGSGEAVSFAASVAPTVGVSVSRPTCIGAHAANARRIRSNHHVLRISVRLPTTGCASCGRLMPGACTHTSCLAAPAESVDPHPSTPGAHLTLTWSMPYCTRRSMQGDSGAVTVWLPPVTAW